jgi:uncharacterized RDD family membrane protein YckC
MTVPSARLSFMACSTCGEICNCGLRSASRAAVAEDPSQLWPATDAAWQDATWRNEITSRVRAHKRKRGTDDTLSLGFEEPELTPEQELAALAPEPDFAERPLPPPPSRYQRIAMKRAQAQYESGNLIMFPPPEPTSVDPVQEALAEPMPQTPRILEAGFTPEAAPEGTAYTAIHLDPIETVVDDTFLVPDLEFPLQVAPISVQIVSWLVDSAFALGGFVVFGTIVILMTGLSATGKAGMAFALGVAVLFWIGYHAMFLVYSGYTPGMNFAGLGLCTFDDDRPSRATCIKRTAALVLSVLSLGMGFVWSALDEDGLGWHDRISRTYLRPL